MYKQFFGFKERPFKLVPNPDYLYLSRSHEEALGHLNYAVSQGEGFVEITGEVGTGKTTLCRMFLENLDNDTEAAFIFNPKLDSTQLLKEINQEFDISSDGITPRDLIETLNSFLMEKRKDGKSAILLIDEAQNLTEDVLEQLRLLSNLETTTNKLIQIILVGQPELGDMLDSHELRQLSQRITLRCHLKPLTLKETKEYIRHRIRIASHKPGARFTGEAFRLVYQYSSGIPRLINIICDRALLTGFTLNRQKISRKIIRSSIKELEGGRQEKTTAGFNKSKSAVLLVSLLMIFLMIVFFQPMLIQEDTLVKYKKTDETILQAMPARNDVGSYLPIVPISKDQAPVKSQISENQKDISQYKTEQQVVIESRTADSIDDDDEKGLKKPDKPVIIRDVNIPAMLYSMNTNSSRMIALQNSLKLWGDDSDVSHYLESMDDDNEFFRLAAKQRSFMCNRIEGDFTTLRKHNMPTILELYSKEGLSPKFVMVSAIDDSTISFLKDESTIIVTSIKELEVYWTGTAYIVWKNFFNYTGVIPVNSSRDSILTLKIHLRKLGFNTVTISPFYDESALAAVREVQKRNGLKVDGIVGPITMIALYNEDGSLKIPHILKPTFDMPG